ncbi:MAG TPA: hypothetical protein VJ912_00325 [Candidatus Nanoarchaeia archaeon]|nr:hypothetical protein [Candidatus Nanoarchaeia archaeon]
METIKNQIEELRQKNIKKIRDLLSLKRRTDEDETLILQKIRELTHNLANASFVDSNTMRVAFFRESNTFLISNDKDIDFVNKKGHDIDALCEYIVDKTIYYYSKRLDVKNKKVGV